MILISNILPLQKRRSKDAIKIFKKWSAQNTRCQKDAITKITGIVTPKSINTLENELSGAFTIMKSTHFAKGKRYG
jgi:hypothetical protein